MLRYAVNITVIGKLADLDKQRENAMQRVGDSINETRYAIGL